MLAEKAYIEFGTIKIRKMTCWYGTKLFIPENTSIGQRSLKPAHQGKRTATCMQIHARLRGVYFGCAVLSVGDSIASSLE